MSFRKLGRRCLHRLIFLGPQSHLAGMRTWALLSLASLLVTIWKMLFQLDKVYSDDFWGAVFGQDLIGKLGPNGFILLALYVVGSVIWWFVTVLLVEISKICCQRLGLRAAKFPSSD